MGEQAKFSRRERRANVVGGRHASHRVKVTPEEEAQLQMLALEHRISVPRLLIESTLRETGPIASVTRDLVAELFAIRRVMSGAAVNINQIAKASNAGVETRGELAGAITLMRKTVERIDAVVEGLIR